MTDKALVANVANAPQVLREYAVIADGFRGGVIGPRGDIAWLCFPTWESPTVFDTLLGGTAAYDVHPVEPFVWGGYYEDGALVWRDRWVTSSGAVVECREALAFPAQQRHAVVLRTLRMVRGSARIRAFLSPKADYGEAPFRSWRRLERGEWTARSSGLHLRWSGEPTAEARWENRAGLVSEFTLAQGDERHLVLELSDGKPDDIVPDPATCWRETEAEWHKSAPSCERTASPRDSRLAHAVLRGMSTPGGGTVAAVTTSLPERAAQGRNYDYRYSWIRDQCFVGRAAAVAGEGPGLLASSVCFVTARLLEDGPTWPPPTPPSVGAYPRSNACPCPATPVVPP